MKSNTRTQPIADESTTLGTPSKRDALEIAVVHGNYTGRGGGEHVAEELARTFDAPIYYGMGYEKYEPDDIECHSLFNDAWFDGIIKESAMLRDLYYFRHFQNVPELHDYDVLIQSGNEMGWYQPPDDQVIVKYTHSTPRNAYDRYPDRAGDGGLLFEMYTSVTRYLYQPVLPYPDIYVPNSEVIERRLDRYWGKRDDVRVVYPPVAVDEFGQERADDAPIDGEYYLMLDRLEATKHPDRIVSAFEDLDARLVVAGDGSLRDELETRTAGNDSIQFLGYVSEDDKRALLADASALAYGAEDEDFGMVPIEALASGTPVIGPREGFTQYQISDGASGYLYDSTVDGLREAVQTFEANGVSATPTELEHFAEQFGVGRFREEMRDVVETAITKAAVQPNLDRPTLDESVEVQTER